MSVSYYEKPNNFNYFDQFIDMEINLTEVLSNFSTELSNSQPVVCKIRNFFERFDLVVDFKKSSTSFIEYTISEGERVEVVSNKFFKVPDLWWLILVVNEIKDPFKDWPLSQDQLNRLIDELYVSDGRYSKLTFQKLLFERNESKRKILIPTENAVRQIINEYRKAIIDRRSGLI